MAVILLRFIFTRLTTQSLPYKTPVTTDIKGMAPAAPHHVFRLCTANGLAYPFTLLKQNLLVLRWQAQAQFFCAQKSLSTGKKRIQLPC